MSEPTSSFQIWVDADACPNEAKTLLFKAAQRTQRPLTMVANQPVRVPASPLIQSVLVTTGLDAADQHIIAHVSAGDLVITADIPLAAEVVAQGAQALNPRGELYTEENIGERLAARHLLDELRQSGMVTGGPAGYSTKDRQAFANQLDRWLTAAQSRGN